MLQLLVRPVPLSQTRAVATDPEMLDCYFDLLEKTMTENDLLDKPCQIYNVDETGLPLDPKAPQLIFQQGERNPAAVGSGNKAQITVVGCVSAGGSCLPPMVIWDRKTLSPELTVGEVPGTIYGLSKKGWIDQELFEVWFLNHFLRYASPARPLLLLLDGHSSHFCPETIQAAAKEQVILFVLPPNTTHLTQPLDKGCFGPLKAKWREVCHAYSVNNPGKVVNRYVFSQLLNQTWMQAMSMKNILAGFRVTGIYPLSRQALQPGQERETSSLTDATGLAFIPLCSPAPHTSKSNKSRREVPVFSSEKLVVFQRSFVKGHHIPERRYSKWVEMYHPDFFKSHISPLMHQDEASETDLSLNDDSLPLDQSDTAMVVMPAPKTIATCRKFFPQLAPPSHLPTSKPKSCGRVLTSAENRKMMEEKQRKKKEVKLCIAQTIVWSSSKKHSTIASEDPYGLVESCSMYGPSELELSLHT